MADELIAALLAAHSSALGVRVRHLSQLTAAGEHGLQALILRSVPPSAGAVGPTDTSSAAAASAALSFAGGQYCVHRVSADPQDVLVVGPLWSSAPHPTPEMRQSLVHLATALRQMAAERSTHAETLRHLDVTHRAMLSISSELELDVVLRRIVEMASDLSGARYAALGVPGPDGMLQAFITTGMTAEAEARMAHRPEGRGLLGKLLHEPETLRLNDLREHPDSIGFPEHHPPMHSFLGVPIPGRRHALGNLYLTEKQHAPTFTEDDARVVELLARHAAVAIENARLYQALDQQQSRLQHIIDWLPEAVLVIERQLDATGQDDGVITIANQHAIDVLGLRMVLPCSATTLFDDSVRYHPDGSVMETESIPVMESLREGVTHIQREVRIVRPDGTRITVLVNSAPLRDAYGSITGAIAVFQDITTIRNAEQLKDDFLSLVSHELRTPLTAIQGGALLLTSSAALDDETRRELLGDIAGESQRLTTLIENMVNIAHIRSGRLSMETGPILLQHPVLRAIATEREQPGEQRATLPRMRVNVPTGLLVLADADRLEQILRNLVQNALKYAPQTPEIEIAAHVAPRATAGVGERVDGWSVLSLGDAGPTPSTTHTHEAIVSVRDHGPGIDADDLPFVFERFRRSRAAASGGRPGLGLGLYLARHLVEAHGGRIWIERPEDGGTRVLFTLPAVNVAAGDRDADSGARPPTRAI